MKNNSYSQVAELEDIFNTWCGAMNDLLKMLHIK